jgi:3-deoxy-D-manno-octulosonic-acid transferase
VILIDAMGLLSSCYQIASIAIVAGSFTSAVGGHNILEPLWFGVPTLFGPYMHAQPDMLEGVMRHQAAWQRPIEEVEEALQRLLTDGATRQALSAAAMGMVDALRGANGRTLKALSTMGTSTKN